MRNQLGTGETNSARVAPRSASNLRCPGSALVQDVASFTGRLRYSGGDGQSYAITDGGRAWVWGDNGWGRLGEGSTTNRDRATRVESLQQVVQVDSGWDHTVFLLADGSVWSAGSKIPDRTGRLWLPA